MPRATMADAMGRYVLVWRYLTGVEGCATRRRSLCTLAKGYVFSRDESGGCRGEYDIDQVRINLGVVALVVTHLYAPCHVFDDHEVLVLPCFRQGSYENDSAMLRKEAVLYHEICITYPPKPHHKQTRTSSTFLSGISRAPITGTTIATRFVSQDVNLLSPAYMM
jgi:hypothetical protein